MLAQVPPKMKAALKPKLASVTARLQALHIELTATVHSRPNSATKSAPTRSGAVSSSSSMAAAAVHKGPVAAAATTVTGASEIAEQLPDPSSNFEPQRDYFKEAVTFCPPQPSPVASWLAS
eukprot:COSAG01_NODE_25_length_37050_cov_211.559119_26_plen_121_part_00